MAQLLSSLPFFLNIMQGIPDFDKVICKAQEFGCQNGELVEEIVPFKGEKPRFYINRALTHMSQEENKISLVYRVTRGLQILPLAQNPEEAIKILTLLSGRRHQIWIGLGFKKNAQVYRRIITTKINFKRLTSDEIKDYVVREEGYRCFGAYQPQGLAARFIKSINGSASALSGLPAFEFQAVVDHWRQCYNG